MMMCMQWMDDFEAFQAAIRSDESYTSTLTQSLALVLDEFYKNLRSVGVSAVSGAGMDAFFKAIDASTEEYMETYKYFLNLIIVLLAFLLQFYCLGMPLLPLAFLLQFYCLGMPLLP